MRSQQETVQPRPLLETKFYPPRSPRDLVPRPRLCDRLVRGTTSKLMLVSAPAGFGKSTVLAQWLDQWLDAEPAADATGRSAAWLSLDQDDNDPAFFWTCVIAALRTAVPGIGETALGLLQAPQPTSIQTVLTTLLNDLGAVEADAVLVLDDYHVIESREVHEGMTFLIGHLPPRLHLVIASRADPPLPLARRSRHRCARSHDAAVRSDAPTGRRRRPRSPQACSSRRPVKNPDRNTRQRQFRYAARLSAMVAAGPGSDLPPRPPGMPWHSGEWGS